MELTMRRFAGEADYWRIRGFLRRIFILNGRTEHSWNVARLDYWRWHVVPNCGPSKPMEESVFIWEDGNGTIRAVLNPESPGEAFLQVDPEARSAALEEGMLEVAEERLSIQRGDGRRLFLAVQQEDIMRRRILLDRGYVETGFEASDYSLAMPVPPEVPPVPSGFTIRCQLPQDVPSRSWASWRAFHPDEPDSGYDGHEWYANLERIPLYRRDLDLIAVDSEGEVAAFTTVWYDDVTRTGYFEPVGRKPEIQVRGLMKCLLLTAAERLFRVGGDLATVGGSSFSANVLYSTVFGKPSGSVLGMRLEWNV